MALHTFRKGLDLPIAGAPEQRIYEVATPRKVAVVALDYIGMKPRMAIAEGDEVKRGQLLFEDKKTAGVRFTAPGAGTVTAINRGERRALQTVVIQLSETERSGTASDDDHITFESYTGYDPAGLTDEQIRALLLESGLWTALRRRPFGKIANPGDAPQAIVVNAMDSYPLAASPDLAWPGNEEFFEKGLLCISKLTRGDVYLCRHPSSAITAGPHSGVKIEEFEGPHPVGTIGFQIHTLVPAGRDKVVWHLDCQDVVAIGKLFATGQLDVTRIVSLAGPSVRNPRVIRTRQGACLDELVSDEITPGEQRVVSGSVLCGRDARGEVHGYLGRYDLQINVLPENRDRKFLGWMAPGVNTFSVLNLFASKLFRGKKFDFSTTTNGSQRAIIPIGVYEKVMPFDLMPTFLLRSLCANDVERSEELGCLELVEEDLALCTFVCPGKNDYGPILRRMLDQIEKEG